MKNSWHRYSCSYYSTLGLSQSLRLCCIRSRLVVGVIIDQMTRDYLYHDHPVESGEK